MVVLFVTDVGQRIEEKEFGHKRRERIFFFHEGRVPVYRSVVVFEISGIGGFVNRILDSAHASQIIQIMRIGHSLRVGAFGEYRTNLIPVYPCGDDISVTHVHEVHVIVYVESVGVFGEPLFQ